MLLVRTDFRKDLLILLIITILLGTLLVRTGGYLTDKYFSRMVTGLIGDYGEYDYLFTLASDKEEMALEQINNVIKNNLPGTTLDPGPEVAGSSNYLLKLPDKYKNKKVYSSMDKYFSDIPGLMSTTVMTEPRISIRGFRGDSLSRISSRLKKINGINFMYPAGDGLDIIAQNARVLTRVKSKIDDILEDYKLLEIRYPLNQRPENIEVLKNKILKVAKEKARKNEIIDVTGNQQSERVNLFKNLKQMKTFLLSYATKITINEVENSKDIPVGDELIIPVENGSKTSNNKTKTDKIEENNVNDNNNDNTAVILEVIENSNNTLTALIQQGKLNGSFSPRVYRRKQDGTRGIFLGKGEINNPRQELTDALDKLNEITPALNGFLQQSEQLVEYSNRLSSDLNSINEGLGKLEDSSQELNQSLKEWQERDLSVFLQDLINILDEIDKNAGNLSQVQSQLITTSNQLKEAARMIGEKIIYIPRNNTLYQELNELKDLFLQLSTGLDKNYDLVAERLENMNPLLASIDNWKVKINSLLKIEDTLNRGAKWTEINGIMTSINETMKVVDTRELQEKLKSIQELLTEVKTTQLPVVLEQLQYIQSSLPDLKESEIIETINLIDKYLAGQVIPGDQIQLLIKGDYDQEELVESIKSIIKNPVVSYLNMNAGMVQPNPRGEVFNILSQVRSVISTIIVFIFTLFVMILDQSLIISMIRLNGGRGYIYSFLSGGLIFSLIYYCSQINFPYFNFQLNFLIGGTLGLFIGLFAGMLNPVSRKEWEAGKALGFSFGEIMHEIMIPAGKPGLLYLINYPRMIFK